MKGSILFVTMTACVLLAVHGGHAQPPGAGSAAGGASGNAGAGAILTAVEVSELWTAGQTDAEIAAAISAQRGYDRQAAHREGLTDEQIIRHLIENPATVSPGATDPGEAAQHKTSGDTHAKEARHDKAAREYTLAIASSGDTQELRLRRAEAYRQYLGTALNPQIRSHSDKPKRDALEKSKALLCHALYADYEAAARLGQQEKPGSYTELKAMQASLGRSAPSDRENEQIPLYHKRAARNIQGTRQMQPKYYEARKKAQRTGFTMEKGIKDYRQVCETAESSAD